MRTLLLFFLFVFTFEGAFSQDDELEEEWQYEKPEKRTGPSPTAHKLSFGVGLASYNGDLNPSVLSITPGMAYTVGFRYFVRKKLTIKPQITLLQLNGDDSKTGNAKRNLSFQSTNIEWGLNLAYDFVEYLPRWDLRKKVAPYVNASFGGLYFNPKAEYEGNTYALQPLQTEGVEYSRFTWILAVGAGVRFALTERSNLNFETRYTYTFTDYLDDVSGTYQDINDLEGVALLLADRTFEGGSTPEDSFDGIYWKEGNERGSRSLNDGYFLFLLEYEVDIFSHRVVYPLF